MSITAAVVFVAALAAIAEGQQVDVGSLPDLAHDVSGRFFVNDAKTFFIKDFNYDGRGPAAYPYYYVVGTSPMNTGGGSIFMAEENSDRFTRRYTDEDITLTLPGDVTVCDLSWFTIWCEAANVFFTKIRITEEVYSTFGCAPGGGPGTGSVEPPTTPIPTGGDHDNCIQLDNATRLSWTLDSNNSVATFLLCGCVSPSENQYIGFGLSGSTDSTNMDGADVTIAWVDGQSGSANAIDYYLSGRVQCRDGQGVCPDTVYSSGVCTDDVFNVSGTRFSGQQCVTYSRKFNTSDSLCDIPIDLSDPQYVVWAVGGIDVTAFKHFRRADPSNPPLALDREPSNECGALLQCTTCPPFDPEVIDAPNGQTFDVKIGPSGGERGYMAITGRTGWGISYWIDGQLIPELVVRRGETYTFRIEAGDDESNFARYHPFYITDSPTGGWLLNTPEERANETVYAGILRDEAFAAGRYCEYQETLVGEQLRLQCGSQEDYRLSALSSLTCDGGSAYLLTWTPDKTTPDEVYYQCAVHLNLGWKITVSKAAALVPHALSVMMTLFLLILLIL